MKSALTKELMLALLMGKSGQIVLSVTIFKVPSRRSTAQPLLRVYYALCISLLFGFKVFSPTVGGIVPCSTASTAFIMPAIPLDGSLWPIFDLIEPINSGLSLDFEPLKKRPMAETSKGSPT